MDDNKERGEELNQLSRLLFDRTAFFWCLAIFIELIAGILGVTFSVIYFSEKLSLVLAISGFALLLFSYFLRLKSEDDYDTAETMRRQSVLTEALDWPISKTLFSKWRASVGKKILENFKVKPRDKDYYSTKETDNNKRLLDMTIESAFYTRHLYMNLKKYIWIIFYIFLILFILIISLSSLTIFTNGTQVKIVYFIYLFLPLILTFDLLGWGLKLNRVSKTIYKIEESLEQLSKEEVSTSKVMRLVSEYNCQVLMGIPIHNLLFGIWHKDIDELWKER